MKKRVGREIGRGNSEMYYILRRKQIFPALKDLRQCSFVLLVKIILNEGKMKKIKHREI
jgi:hypothetical protein